MRTLTYICLSIFAISLIGTLAKPNVTFLQFMGNAVVGAINIGIILAIGYFVIKANRQAKKSGKMNRMKTYQDNTTRNIIPDDYGYGVGGDTQMKTYQDNTTRNIIPDDYGYGVGGDTQWIAGAGAEYGVHDTTGSNIASAFRND